MSESDLQQKDDIFVIYPAHLAWLMEENKLTVPEICAALGMPSLQEWYNIQKEPQRPVPHPRIVQTARIYLRHPEWLPVSLPSLRSFIQRSFQLIGDDQEAITLIEALLHKQWGTIQEWLTVDEHQIDLSARRLLSLMLKMDDSTFKRTLLDGSLSFYVQVNASPVHTFTNKDESVRRFATSHQPENLREAVSILEVAPIPGKRVKKDQYVLPNTPVTDFKDIIAETGGSSSATEPDSLDEAYNATANKLVWHNN